MNSSGNNSWIGVDLDGTLAHYDGWKGEDHIGEPVPLMLTRVKRWVANGWRIKIFTARVSRPGNRSHQVITDWLKKHGLPELEITCVKDYGMLTLWDDRCVQVEKNTGRPVRKDDDL